jgi:predicted Zn finger-like uncharacterized protein
MAGMFTVCPKCALTLVVTAGDLRVAQGYVRCGRCSNVFNALARLSEDRNAAAAVAASQAPPAAPPSEQPAREQAPAAPPPSQYSMPPARASQPTSSYTFSRPPEPVTPSARAPRPSGAPVRSVQQPTTPPARTTQAPAAPPTRAPPGGTLPGDIDVEAIPEDALEFNPAAADVNQVFVEPPPNPEWTAATGTFKAIILRSEEAAQSTAATQAPNASKPKLPDQSASRSGAPIAPTGSDVTEIELDADFLSDTAQMRKLKMGLNDADSSARMTVGTPSGSQTQFAPTKATSGASPAEASSYPQPQTPPETQSQPRQRPTLTDTQALTRLRGPTADTQPPPQPRSSVPEPGLFPETEAASRVPPRKTVRAFGLDSVEPPPERFTSVARSRVGPATFELESAGALSRLTGSPTFWSAGSAAFLALLVAQVVNHYRNDLAATPAFNKPITALYSALGVHLTPRWDLRAYDVRQLGASVDAENAGQIMVRASVKNGGHQAQPLPLLRVTLQDRFGNRIAARDVPPVNYLPRAIPPASLLSAGQRVDAEMAFVDPGSNAVGFEIDACLPAPAGGIACANDPVSR